MSTEQAFIINDGSYDEEADDSKKVLIRYMDEDYISFDPPLGGCLPADILELADWISGKPDERSG